MIPAFHHPDISACTRFLSMACTLSTVRCGAEAAETVALVFLFSAQVALAAAVDARRHISGWGRGGL